MSLAGLKEYRASKEKQATSSASKYYKIGDGQKVKIRPLQELDPDSVNYSAKNGLAKFTKEWQNPMDWTRVCVDTMEEEGASVGAELLREFGWGGTTKEEKGWRPKDRMYINILVDDGENDPFVAVLQCNIAPKAAQGPALIDHSDESEGHTVTDRWWLFSREGKGETDTTYKLKPQDPPKEALPSVEDYELIDLDSVLPRVPYAQQRIVLGADDWIARFGDRVKAATAAKTAGKANGTAATERVATQNTEW